MDEFADLIFFFSKKASVKTLPQIIKVDSPSLNDDANFILLFLQTAKKTHAPFRIQLELPSSIIEVNKTQNKKNPTFNFIIKIFITFFYNLFIKNLPQVANFFRTLKGPLYDGAKAEVCFLRENLGTINLTEIIFLEALIKFFLSKDYTGNFFLKLDPSKWEHFLAINKAHPFDSVRNLFHDRLFLEMISFFDVVNINDNNQPFIFNSNLENNYFILFPIFERSQFQLCLTNPANKEIKKIVSLLGSIKEEKEVILHCNQITREVFDLLLNNQINVLIYVPENVFNTYFIFHSTFEILAYLYPFQSLYLLHDFFHLVKANRFVKVIILFRNNNRLERITCIQKKFIFEIEKNKKIFHGIDEFFDATYSLAGYAENTCLCFEIICDKLCEVKSVIKAFFGSSFGNDYSQSLCFFDSFEAFKQSATEKFLHKKCKTLAVHSLSFQNENNLNFLKRRGIEFPFEEVFILNKPFRKESPKVEKEGLKVEVINKIHRKEFYPYLYLISTRKLERMKRKPITLLVSEFLGKKIKIFGY